MSNRIGAFTPKTGAVNCRQGGRVDHDAGRWLTCSAQQSRAASGQNPFKDATAVAPRHWKRACGHPFRTHAQRRSRRSMLPAKDRLSGFGGRQAGVEIAVKTTYCRVVWLMSRADEACFDYLV